MGIALCAQTLFAFQDSTSVKSEWRNEPMSIEDNSFLIEEAFNQSSGVIQYTLINQLTNGSTNFNFECEFPLKRELHQLSFSIPAKLDQSFFGLEDLVISYRPLLSGRHRWVMVAPRFSLVIPTGKFSRGFGSGLFGLEWNLALTKRLSRGLITHVNLGSSHLLNNTELATLPEDKTRENRLQNRFAGASLILALARNCDFMTEFKATNEVKGNWNLAANPGFRFLLKVKEFAIVPGISSPLEWRSGKPMLSQILVYLSIERLQ